MSGRGATRWSRAAGPRQGARAVAAAAVVVACGARAAPASVAAGTMSGKVTVLGVVVDGRRRCEDADSWTSPSESRLRASVTQA